MRFLLYQVVSSHIDSWTPILHRRRSRSRSSQRRRSRAKRAKRSKSKSKVRRERSEGSPPQNWPRYTQVVATQIFIFFHPESLGKWFPILTSIFFKWVGCNHQLETIVFQPSRLSGVNSLVVSGRVQFPSKRVDPWIQRPSSHLDLWQNRWAAALLQKPRLRRRQFWRKGEKSRKHTWGVFLKWWVYPTTIGFPTKNDHFGVWNGENPPFRKHPSSPRTLTAATWIRNGGPPGDSDWKLSVLRSKCEGLRGYGDIQHVPGASLGNGWKYVEIHITNSIIWGQNIPYRDTQGRLKDCLFQINMSCIYTR